MDKWTSLLLQLETKAFLSQQNPVVRMLKTQTMSQEQGLEVLRQYYFLVMTIVQFLTIAMVRIPIQKAKQELRQNLEEELGSRTNGVSHQELLEKLVEKELGTGVRTVWNEATKTFISGMLLNFNIYSPHTVAGMVYALEATACLELTVVAEIINLSAGQQVVNLQPGLKPKAADTLASFIAMHTEDFEIGHESGLRETLDEFADEYWEEFQEGFLDVLAKMQIWWNELAKA